MAKVRRSNDIIGSLSADLSQIKVEDGSILVLRSDRDWKEGEMQRLQDEVDQSLPADAKCLLLVMRTDEAFETVPREAAKAIYTELKKHFEPNAISIEGLEEYVMRATMGKVSDEDWKVLEAVFHELKKPLPVKPVDTTKKEPSDGGVTKH